VLTTKALNLAATEGSAASDVVPGARLLADHHLQHGVEYRKHKPTNSGGETTSLESEVEAAYCVLSQ
jgi:hypothetical protein